MNAMEPPYRLRTDLARVVEDGFAFPLGVEQGGLRPRMPGWSVEVRRSGDEQPNTLTYTVVVSHELVRPLTGELMRLLPARVSGILELGSRDAFREVDVFIGEPIDFDRFHGPWELFESLLLEEATLGVGVNAPSPFIEIFLDHDKRIFIHIDPVHRRSIESILSAWRISRRRGCELEPSPQRGVVTRPILRDLPRHMVDTDHLLAELRIDWNLHLDEDPERNLDARGREMGATLWRALVFVDQEDPAGRRHGQAQVWAIATSRRHMQEVVNEAIGTDVEWEYCELMSMDRVAFDDRPSELDGMSPILDADGILLYRVDPLGTAAQQWNDRDD